MDILSTIGIYLLSAVVFLLIFSVLIIIHELGHFWAARKGNIQVEEFGFGLPPRIWGKKSVKTIKYKDEDGQIKTREEEMIWSINAIPFGGFVKMTGEEKESTSKFSFSSRPLRWRILTVCGGVIMNFILGWVLLFGAYFIGTKPLPIPDKIPEYIEEGVLEQKEGIFISSNPSESFLDIDILPKDEIIEIGGRKITEEKSVDIFWKSAIAENNDSIPVKIRRFDGKKQEFFDKEILIPITPKNPFWVPVTRVEISEVLNDGKAKVVGMLPGDIIVSIEGTDIYKGEQFIKTILELKRKGYREAHIGILRGEKEMMMITPFNQEGEIGVMLDNKIIGLETDEDLQNIAKKQFIATESKSVFAVNDIKYPFLKAATTATNDFFFYIELSIKGLKMVVNEIVSKFTIPDEISGPVGIANAVHNFVNIGYVSLLIQLTAILSISIGFMNILPFPGLDGGRLVFLLAELLFLMINKPAKKLIGKNIMPEKVPENWEMPLHSIGFIILLIFIIAVSYNDIVRIFFS